MLEESKKNYFFVTGLYRSGTTLLERLLDSHESVTVLSQPFPYLFYRSKGLFLHSRGVFQNYPIATMFGEESYIHGELSDFLDEQMFSRELISKWHEEMAGYSGHKSSFLNVDLDTLSGGRLSDVYLEVLRLYESALGADRDHVGAKEIVCDEFMPSFLRDGLHVLHLLRDPRDVICSLHGKRSAKFIGQKRPILFTLRAWRKSVALHIICKKFMNYHMIRFEDLVLNVDAEINKCFSFLGIMGRGISVDRILDVHGNAWDGNSSHGPKIGVDSSATGQYRGTLDDETISFVEKICYAEMKYLGYTFEQDDETVLAYDLTEFREEEFGLRSDMEDYLCSNSNLEMENFRLSVLKQCPIDSALAVKYFISSLVWKELRKNVVEL